VIFGKYRLNVSMSNETRWSGNEFRADGRVRRPVSGEVLWGWIVDDVGSCGSPSSSAVGKMFRYMLIVEKDCSRKISR
jgi:hypothetical protein